MKTAQHVKSSLGFTLIELMVVIALIAILSVIGVSVYSNTQKQARDAARRTDIDSLAKSIESSRDVTASVYAYSATNYASDFPTAKPKDPVGTTLYCYSGSTTAAATIADPTATTWATSATCPTSWVSLVDGSGNFGTAFPVTAGAQFKTWKLCARLEVGSAVFCKTSLFLR